jgi:hypothetical protein
MMVDPPAVGPLGAADGALAEDAGAEAAGADAGAVVGTVAAALDVGEVVAALLHAAARPAMMTMAAAIRFLECMSHLFRSRRTDRGQAV